MDEKTQLLFMQTRLIRLAAEHWNVSVLVALDIFKKFNVLKYINEAFGIFHCEGDETVLEDIEEYLDRKGHKFNG